MLKITYERVRELFDYRSDGMLIWRVARNNNVRIGDVAGSICATHGYCMIGIDGTVYRAHRLIWLWHYGYMPESELDHINRIRYNNRIENLREASRSCNLRNTGNQKNNKSGVKGVCKPKDRSKWLTQITASGKQYNLGRFDDFDEAVLHRLAAEQCLDWSSCDSSSPAYKHALRNGLIKRRRT